MPHREPLPPHLNKWNWGAFTLNWVWGLGNRVYIALLMFVPGVNLVMPFVLGAKGTQWAWQNGDWASEEEFVRAQKIWSRVGVCTLVGVPVFFALVIGLAFMGVRNSDAFEMSFDIVQNNAEVIAVIGEPMDLSIWTIFGTINFENNDGDADIAYDVSGPYGSGTVHFLAVRENSRWQIIKHTFSPLPDGDQIDLTKSKVLYSRLSSI